MRGKKLLAWELPPLLQNLSQSGAALTSPAGSKVAQRQTQLWQMTEATLKAIADDVQRGLRETVGIESRLRIRAKAAMEIELPPDTDLAKVARAVDLENLEAWLDDGKVCVGIGPWYTTKDVDQVVLCVTKVVHVMLGLHAKPQRTGKQRLFAAVADVLELLQPATPARAPE